MTQNLILIGIIFTVLSLFIIWLLSGYISTPIILLVDELNEIGRGSYKHPITIHETRDEIGVLSRAFNDMRLNINAREDDLKKSIKEKEILIRELYHRTKNNMQVISSMLSLQSSYEHDEKLSESFEKAQIRIQSMALVHEKLYESKDLSNIRLDEYLMELINLLKNSYGINSSNISLVINLEPITVLIDTAIPLGLILNEIISNSVKHAFQTEKKGEIIIQLLEITSGTIVLKISDNGVGISDNFDYRTTNTLGITTIIGLVESQLNGELSFEHTSGTAWTIQFRDNLYEERI